MSGFAALWKAAFAALYAGALPPHPQSRRRRLGEQEAAYGLFQLPCLERGVASSQSRGYS